MAIDARFASARNILCDPKATRRAGCQSKPLWLHEMGTSAISPCGLLGILNDADGGFFSLPQPGLLGRFGTLSDRDDSQV
jgi:hypothetical protein